MDDNNILESILFILYEHYTILWDYSRTYLENHHESLW